MKRLLVFVMIVLPILAAGGVCDAKFRFVHSYQSVSTGNFVGTQMAVHQESGDILLSGYYSGKSIFGGAAMDSAGGVSQAFLMRVGAAGGVKWVREIRGAGDQRAHGVAVDVAGNSYVIGESIGEVLVQGGAGGSDTELNSTGKFMFLAKYSPGGDLLWVTVGTSSEEMLGRAVAVDAVGNVYAAGSFMDTAIFGTKSVAGEEFFNGYLAKYDSLGAIQWVRVASSSLWCQVHGVAASGDGSITVIGEFSGTMSGLVSSGDYDAFVVRYSSAGDLQWARSGSGAGRNIAYGVAADPTGGFVVVGQMEGTTFFEGNEMVSAGGYDGFVARYDSSGNLSWAARFGGVGNDAARGVSISPSGRIAVAGAISGSVEMDSEMFESHGGADAFIGLYSPSGDFLSGFTGGGAGNDVGRTAAWLGDLLAVAGGFTGAAAFGDLNLGTHAELDGGELFISILGDVLPSGGIAGDFTGSGRVGLDDVIAILQMLTFQR